MMKHTTPAPRGSPDALDVNVNVAEAVSSATGHVSRRQHHRTHDSPQAGANVGVLVKLEGSAAQGS